MAFVPFGITLQIRPLVGDNDTITIDLLPQVTSPDPGLTSSLRETTGTDPLSTAFRTRSFRTSAKLQDGQALLMAGLLTRDRSDDQTSSPILEDVPIVNWLFKQFSRRDDTQELVVVVNPVIIREPVSDVALVELPRADELLSCDVWSHAPRCRRSISMNDSADKTSRPNDEGKLFGNNEQGGILIEFALLSLVFYMLAALVVDFGRMMFVAQTLQDAARVAARELAVIPLPANITFEEMFSNRRSFRSRIFQHGKPGHRYHRINETNNWPLKLPGCQSSIRCSSL